MYQSHVVTGRIIEIQENRILTQQGEITCTYHSRYYMLPPEEIGLEVESDPPDALLLSEQAGNSIETTKKSRIPVRDWLHLQKKSANQI